MNIGAADVDFQPAHLFLLIQLFTGIGVIRRGKAGDVGHDGLVEAGFQLREFFGYDFVHAGILQPHGVDHAAGTLGDAGGGISKTGFFRGSLEGEGAKAVDVIQFGKLITVAKGAGGGDDRVVQLDAAEIDAQASHRISSFRMTGPSLQMRLYPVRVLQEQPMQAPKPQPIRSSKLIWPEVRVALYTALSIGSGPQV